MALAAAAPAAGGFVARRLEQWSECLRHLHAHNDIGWHRAPFVAFTFFRHARRMTKTAPLPSRLARLERDPRGYPIFFGVYVDATGTPHFSIADARQRQRMIGGDL